MQPGHSAASFVDRSHRKQAVFFQKGLVLIFACYALGFTILWMTVLQHYTSAPLVAAIFVSLAQSFAVAVGMRAACSDTLYVAASVLAALACSASIALPHPKVQAHVMALTGECSSRTCTFGTLDYRTDGPLILAHLLYYQIFFILRTPSAIITAFLSILLYNGLVMAAGAVFDPIDLTVVCIPVFISLGGQMLMERLRGRVDLLLRELGERCQREQSMRIEAEMLVRQQAAVFRAGIREEDSLTFELSLTTASAVSDGQQQHEQEQGQGQEQEAEADQRQELPQGPEEGRWQERQVQLWQQQGQQHRQRREAGAPSSIDASVQTEGGSVRSGASENCTQTDIVWDKEGFRCTRCSRPPRAPTHPSSDDQQRARAMACSSWSGRAPPRRRHRKKDDSEPARVLRLPGVPSTPRNAQLSSLLTCCLAWNVKLLPDRCCYFHALVDEAIYLAVQKLRKLPCQEGGEDAEKVLRCGSCGLCATDSRELGMPCMWCAEGELARPSEVQDSGSVSYTSASSAASEPWGGLKASL